MPSRFWWTKRARNLWRDAAGPVVVLAAIALVEQLVSLVPQMPEPAPLVMVAVVIAGFFRGLNSAVLCSLIGVAYALILVPERHEQHGTSFAFCVEALFLGAVMPLLALAGGALRAQANRVAETLQRHLTNTPLGVIELYEDFEVRLWAGAAASIFGIDQHRAVGKSLFELPGIFFDESDAQEVRRLLEELRGGKAMKAVHPMRSEAKDGSPGHSRWFWSSVLDTRGLSSQFLVLVEDVTERVRAEQELERSKTEVIQRLVRAAEYRDDDTGMHVVRMSRYCEALGKAAGLPEDECTLLFTAAPMHDIGKIGVPDSVLLKRGPLTPEEYETVKAHTLIGADVLAGSEHELVRMAESIALTHHENWDGTGYPNGLAGEQIPLVGRICAVCDIFDALTSARPYKEAWTIEHASQELRKLSGVKLDPWLVEAFLSILPEIAAIRARFDQRESFTKRHAA